MQKALRKIIADLIDLDMSLEPFVIEVKERNYKSLNDLEMQTILLACEGHTTEETGRLMFKSTKTIAAYRREILQKLACKTMSQAIALLFKAQILK